MPRWQAEIKAADKQFRTLISATVIFDAPNLEAADEQANAYAYRLGKYDEAEVDSLHEMA